MRYVVVIDAGRKPDGRRHQLKARFDTRREARAWQTKTRASVDDGTYMPTTKVTVAEHLELWLAGRRDLKPGTAANYRDAAKVSTASFGAKLLREITKADVDRMVTAMLAGDLRRRGRPGTPLSPETARLSLAVLTMALDAAVREGTLARNVAALVERPRQERRPKTVWEAAEAERFTTLSDQDRLAGGWRLSLSGLRRGEVLGSCWDDVDVNAGEVHVWRTRVLVDGEVVDQGTAKSRSSARLVPLTAAGVAALRRTSARQAQERLAGDELYRDSGLVVVDELGRPVAPRWFGDRFRALSRQAGVPVVSLHTARHGYGSHLLNQGVPLPVVSRVMGHASVHVTAQVYAHVIREGADDRVRAAMTAAGL